MVGEVYSDGSCMEGFVKELGRCGWSCVVLDVDGDVLAAAYGVHPPWINDMVGGEA